MRRKVYVPPLNSCCDHLIKYQTTRIQQRLKPNARSSHTPKVEVTASPHLRSTRNRIQQRLKPNARSSHAPKVEVTACSTRQKSKSRPVPRAKSRSHSLFPRSKSRSPGIFIPASSILSPCVPPQNWVYTFQEIIHPSNIKEVLLILAAHRPPKAQGKEMLWKL